MSFGDDEGAIGYLVGEEQGGMRAMFTMMNFARVQVGLEGLAVAERAYQGALAYARERVQGARRDGAAARPAAIIEHPDVRRTLVAIKARIEAMRALVYTAAACLDRALRAPDADDRRRAAERLDLMTPLVKAWCSDQGFEIASEALQVHGGMGYIEETGAAQHLRDARINMIYEGTNGIQALDLVGRKLGAHYGRLLRSFFHPVMAFIERHQADPELGEFVLPLAKAYARLQQVTLHVAQQGLRDPNEAGAASYDYLRLFALVALAYLWARMVQIAQARLAAGANGDAAFYEAKVRTARFFMAKMLPESGALFAQIMAGGKPVMEFEDAAF